MDEKALGKLIERKINDYMISHDDFIKDSLLIALRPEIETMVRNKVDSILDIPLTVKRASDITGRSVSSIYKMCSRDNLPSTKTNGKLHISLRALIDTLLFE